MIHFVYVKGDHIATPFAITNELAARLAKHYEIEVHDWASRYAIQPKTGDILLGHPYPDSGHVFERSFPDPRWKRRILLCPFTHAIPEDDAFLDPLVQGCDTYLAICAEYWIDSIDQSLFSHWRPKMHRIDLAVNRQNFPFLKSSFNPAGKRRFLYIGRLAYYKGIDFLCELVTQNPEIQFGWIGPGELNHAGLISHGNLDFRNEDARSIVSQYDFLLSCGRADANPTTILEAASFGLVPVCTPQSGYYHKDWIVNIPFGNSKHASQILRDLNDTSQEVLHDMQLRARRALDSDYTWERFTQTVVEAIEGKIVGLPMEASEKTAHNRKEITQLRRKKLRQERLSSVIHYIRRIAKPHLLARRFIDKWHLGSR